jgi:hypothetical protein
MALAKAAKAKSIALTLPSIEDSAVPGGDIRRHEHVHDIEKRVGDDSAAAGASVCQDQLHGADRRQG